MKGVILEKYFDDTYSSYGSKLNKYLNLVFKLKIIELDKEVNDHGGIIKVEDEFQFYLQFYGKEIE